jgi:hypothetical protein
MDINRNGRTVPSGQPSTSTHASSARRGWLKIMRLTSIVLLFSSTVLVVALLLSFVFSDNRKEESRFVDSDRMQAVFMNGGQVYFGKVTSLNKQYLTLRDIYYLQVRQQVQPGEKTPPDNIQLTKLGCELHGPEDLMVINREQVIFWENLKEDGKVAKAIDQFKSQNPNGLECKDDASADNN